MVFGRMHLSLGESGAAAEEGGGAPEWVPENAFIHIDLVGGSPQGRAWTEADGIVDVDTMLGADPNTDNSWGPTDYDDANLTADGYQSATPVALIGAALTKMLAGATCVVKIKQVGAEAPDDLYFVMASADAAEGMEVTVNFDNVRLVAAACWGGSLNNSTAVPVPTS